MVYDLQEICKQYVKELADNSYYLVFDTDFGTTEKTLERLI